MSGEDHPQLVVLDRDGVINAESADFIRSPDEWRPLPGSVAAIAALSRAGFTVVVATNQSGVARGLFTLEVLAAIHARMSAAIAAEGGRLAGIFVCPHGPGDGCDCRKPLPGLLHQIEARFGTTLAGRPVVGDSLRDLEAAWQVSGRAILVQTGNGQKTRRELGKEALGDRRVEIFPDLAAVARQLIAEGAPC